MTSFTKEKYLRPLVPNVENLDKTTNPSFKIHLSQLLRKMNHSLFCPNIIFNMLQYLCVCSNLQKYQETSKWNIQMCYIRETRWRGGSTHLRIYEHKYSGEVQPHPKTLLVYYSDMVLPITKNIQGKN